MKKRTEREGVIEGTSAKGKAVRSYLGLGLGFLLNLLEPLLWCTHLSLSGGEIELLCAALLPAKISPFSGNPNCLRTVDLILDHSRGFFVGFHNLFFGV